MNAAFLLIDVINEMDFPDCRKLLKYAVPAAAKIAALRKRLKAHGVPIIYVNDNFGQWRSDFPSQVRRCLEPECAGRIVAEQLVPEEDDYFVLKPRHSGFFSTSLDVLLQFLEVDTLVLAGFAADICVLYTANDAFMREYSLIVPSDCVASETVAGTDHALEHMRTRLRARVIQSRSLRVE